jgi:hypothetical protein
MARINWIAVLACAFLTFAGGIAHALPLEGRLPTTPGGIDYQAYYDPNLDITWAANANLGVNQRLFDDAVSWVAALDIGGVTGWRLPSADVGGDGTVIDCTGGGVSGCADNEMGFLFFEEGIANTSPGPFTNVDLVDFWSGTESAADPDRAWKFLFNIGTQLTDLKTADNYVWAVHSGDVGSAPEPASGLLLGAALIVLALGASSAPTRASRTIRNS